MRLWGGRFADETDDRVAAFGRSVEIDAAMAIDDIDGSLAHVDGLAAAGLLTPDEAESAPGWPPRAPAGGRAQHVHLGRRPRGRPHER